MVSELPSFERQASNRSSGHGHGKAERTPGTPRKEDRMVKERALQDPGLKDYVRVGSRSTTICLLIHVAETWRVPGQGSFRFSIQSFQLGYGGSCSYQADQAG